MGAEVSRGTLVSSHVLFELALPEVGARARCRGEAAVRMTVPEASVNENCDTPAR